MLPPDYTEEYEITHASFERPHVVLLGAGASYAAFPNGDRNGRKLPLLRDFVDVIDLRIYMKEARIQPPLDDFEAIYSNIALNPELCEVRERIDQTVYEYFECLELPDEPTLYDHLVLSLRAKDVVATFNWDPSCGKPAIETVDSLMDQPYFFFMVQWQKVAVITAK